MICAIWYNLFGQFKKREKHLWRSKVAGKSNTLPWVFTSLFKFYKWYQIVQSVSFKVTTKLKNDKH